MKLQLKMETCSRWYCTREQLLCIVLVFFIEFAHFGSTEKASLRVFQASSSASALGHRSTQLETSGLNSHAKTLPRSSLSVPYGTSQSASKSRSISDLHYVTSDVSLVTTSSEWHPSYSGNSRKMKTDMISNVTAEVSSMKILINASKMQFHNSTSAGIASLTSKMSSSVVQSNSTGAASSHRDRSITSAARSLKPAARTSYTYNASSTVSALTVLPSLSSAVSSVTSSTVSPSSISAFAHNSSTTSLANITSAGSTAVSQKTVTMCPWDTLVTAMIMPSPSTSAYVASSFHFVSNSSDIKPAKKGCDVVLQGLSNAMANISHCMLQHLHPLEVCRKCTGPFTEMEVYHKFAFGNCGKELITDYFEQYQLIPKMYDFQRSLWNSFKCEKCYESRDSNNPSAPWVQMKDFKMFEHLLTQSMVCFANHSKLHLPYQVHVNNSQSANSTNSAICHKCKSLYVQFRELVKSSDEKESLEKRWCADMVYGLNETRKIWAENCVEKRGDMQSIIALTCFFCFIPIVFYVGTKLHSDVKERKNESRLHYESD